jgi:hypothetical protein
MAEKKKQAKPKRKGKGLRAHIRRQKQAARKSA